MPKEVTLAMPVGLPPTGVAPDVHYAQLATRMTANKAGNVIHVWVSDENDYSGLFTMSRGMTRIVPSGAAMPDGSTASTPSLLLKPWLWDYLALRQAAAPGAVLPKQIAYANVDIAQLDTAVATELSANQRYGTLTTQERTDAKSDFLAGASRLLFAGGVLVARSQIDPSPPGGVPAGRRRLDLSFLDGAGVTLDPAPYFDLWALLSGPAVKTHPLLSTMARPVTPALAPQEGGTRVRISGMGFGGGTTVDVDGQGATDVKTSADGQTAWATLPSHAVGAADVVVTLSGGTALTHSDAVTYVAELGPAARAVLNSFEVRLAELRDRATEMDDAGTLDADAKARFASDFATAENSTPRQIDDRAKALGTPGVTPDVEAAWDDAGAAITELSTAVEALVA